MNSVTKYFVIPTSKKHQSAKSNSKNNPLGGESDAIIKQSQREFSRFAISHQSVKKLALFVMKIISISNN